MHGDTNPYFPGTDGWVIGVLGIVRMRCVAKEGTRILYSQGRYRMRRRFSFHTRMKLLSKIAVGAGVLVASLLTSASIDAGTVTFGSGVNTFNMEFVTIGNPGNAADTLLGYTPSGRVDYTYAIGKFEVSADMINKFNASQFFKITNKGNWSSVHMPASNITWNEAARFVNWLNSSTGHPEAYKYSFFNAPILNANITTWAVTDPGYDPNNPYRNKLAKYVLPSNDEWFKAAYYDPSLNGGGGGYWDQGTGSNTPPTAVLSGTLPNTAVYYQPLETGPGPAEITQAGGLSAYGAMAFVGNVHEWTETSKDRTNSDGNMLRIQRGGAWFYAPLNRGAFSNNEPSFRIIEAGFRVAMLNPSNDGGGGGGGGGGGEVPEPTSMAIFGLGVLGMAYRARRKSKNKQDTQEPSSENLAS